MIDHCRINTEDVKRAANAMHSALPEGLKKITTFTADLGQPEEITDAPAVARLLGATALRFASECGVQFDFTNMDSLMWAHKVVEEVLSYQHMLRALLSGLVRRLTLLCWCAAQYADKAKSQSQPGQSREKKKSVAVAKKKKKKKPAPTTEEEQKDQEEEEAEETDEQSPTVDKLEMQAEDELPHRVDKRQPAVSAITARREAC
jgi:hypothetical protein